MATNKIEAHDLDVTPEQLGAMSRSGLFKATLLATPWTTVAGEDENGDFVIYHYKQSVTVNGVKDGDKPIISCGEPTTLDASSYKALNKNYAMINRAVVEGDGKITFYCYAKCPTIDIPVFIKI